MDPGYNRKGKFSIHVLSGADRLPIKETSKQEKKLNREEKCQKNIGLVILEINT